jgi:uncharacterized protein (DUF3820 family)
MDTHGIESIKADACIIESVCSAVDLHDPGLLLLVRDSCRRIQECCERASKRTKKNEEEDNDQDKAELVERSRKAAEFILPFGKHKGVQLGSVPTSYLCWLLGVKREGREFKSIPMDKHNWIITNHADVVAEVRAFLVWRCWACSSTDVRFQWSRMCCDCWHGTK